jgi:hypothetical protein
MESMKLTGNHVYGLIKNELSTEFFNRYNVGISEEINSNAVTYYPANDFNRIGNNSAIYSNGYSLLPPSNPLSEIYYHNFYGPIDNPLLFGLERDLREDSSSLGKTVFSSFELLVQTPRRIL